MNLNTIIPNSEVAYLQTRRYLYRLHNKIFVIEQRLNKNRHLIISNPDFDTKYYMMYKHENLLTFNKQFPEFVKNNPEYSGVGQSINEYYINMAAGRNCKIIIILESGYIMSIYANIWKKFAEKHNLIRKQIKENYITLPDGKKTRRMIRERTYCLPIKMFEGDV